MGTTDNFDVPASALPLAASDRIPILSASTGRGAYLTGDQMTTGLGGVVATTAGATTLTITQASHAGKTVVLNNTAPIAVTLPQATGTGSVYRFFVGAAATGTASTIKVANATDHMLGLSIVSTTSSTALIWVATATDDTISINGSTKGGLVGDMIELRDVATGIFAVETRFATTGAAATPFSATV